MTCPVCLSKTRTLFSKVLNEGAIKKRRRRCESCGHRFNTVEIDKDYFEMLEKNLTAETRKKLERAKEVERTHEDVKA